MSNWVTNEDGEIGQAGMENNALIINEYFSLSGWTPNAIAAILGNMQPESGINPARWENDNVGNLGGGFGIKYVSDDDPLTASDYIKNVSEAVKMSAKKHNLACPFLVFEPGRSIVAPAGITLYTVGGVKEIKDVRTYVSIDGGMGDNPRYILYGSKYSAVLANKANEKATEPVTIAGKCCESGDLIAENIMMPKIEVGDTVAILATGAYNYSMASNYNRIPRPPIVAVSENKKQVIVNRETYDDIIKNDLL